MERPKSWLACACALLLCACAAAPAKRDPRDPFERFNRGVYRFNDAADRLVLRAVARGWDRAVPRPVRTGLANLTDNLGYPTTIANDALQGKLRDSASDAARLVVNVVFGLGVYDAATRVGLEKHHEDFGQTLGRWGVPSGPFLELPLLGPSSVRDAPAKLVNEYTDGRHYIKDTTVRWGLWAVDKVELRASLLAADPVLQKAYDPYSFVRNAWLQRREFEVRDGDVPADADFGDDPGAQP
jgi:phospholipid-binding lipoprotein MlaA